MGNNIGVPFSSFIIGGVSGDSEVVIAGRPETGGARFSISLCTGKMLTKGDIALHFNPRFDESVVVRNHKQGGSWGAEERSGGLPFKVGQDFVIAIKAFKSGYIIKVNQYHFCDFNHRLPQERVQFLLISGDVSIDYVHAGGSIAVPEVGLCDQPPPYQPPLAYPPLPAPCKTIYNPSVPLHIPIDGGMYPGKIIYISGTPFRGPRRFHINLACGSNKPCDLALHFDVRFNFSKDRNVVVRTHRQEDYGSNERHQMFFPFLPGTKFEVMILCEEKCFKIAVNNSHFTDFNHRILPVQRVNYIQVKEHVTISEIRFQ